MLLSLGVGMSFCDAKPGWCFSEGGVSGNPGDCLRLNVSWGGGGTRDGERSEWNKSNRETMSVESTQVPDMQEAISRPKKCARSCASVRTLFRGSCYSQVTGLLSGLPVTYPLYEPSVSNTKAGLPVTYPCMSL